MTRNAGSKRLQSGLATGWLATLGLVSGAGVVLGDWEQAAFLYAADGHTESEYGRSMAMDGDTLVIGAPRQNWHGAVYVYRYDGTTWGLEQAIYGTDLSSYEGFGISVALDGDRMAVAAAGVYTSPQGAVHVFDRIGGQWVEQAVLKASDGEPNDRIGWWDLSVDGDRIAVSATRDDDHGIDCGAVYTFVKSPDGWIEEAKLLPPFNSDNANFGRAVVVRGETLLVGRDAFSYGEDIVYAYRWEDDAWNLYEEIRPGEDFMVRRFGTSMDVDGNSLIVGAYQYDHWAGAAYIYNETSDGWRRVAKLTSPSGEENFWFGLDVAIDGERAAVGATGAYEGDSCEGLVYIFDRHNGPWMYRGYIEARVDSACVPLGWAVGVEGDTVVASSYEADGAVAESGVAFAFDFTGSIPCSGDIDGDGDTDAADLGELLSSYGLAPDDPLFNPDADFNEDGEVGQDDLGILLADLPCETD